MTDNYFTTKIASQHSFCNRQTESKELENNIRNQQPTVIVAPRRFGKTSLAMRALSQNKCVYARVDLFCVVFETDICKKIAKGISKLIMQMATVSQKVINLLEQCFKSTLIGIKSGQIEISIELGKAAQDPISQLEDLLEGLERFAAQRNQPVVIFLDEFQDILKADKANQIQAAIRDAAQHAQYVNYIFSGSSRNMLSKIFDNKNQPLYMLCNKITLDKIQPKHFQKHIQHAASKQWGGALPEEAVALILELTECHPYYVNVLCNKLWNGPRMPDINTIQQQWCDVLSENKGKIIADLEHLSGNRMKVLSTIALLNGVNEPNSKMFVDVTGMPVSSIQAATKFLLAEDYLYNEQGTLKLIDPLLKKFIHELHQ